MPTVEQGFEITQWIEAVFGPSGLVLIFILAGSWVLFYFVLRLLLNKHEAERRRWRGDIKEAFGQATAVAEGNAASRQELTAALTDLSKEIQFLKRSQ